MSLESGNSTTLGDLLLPSATMLFRSIITGLISTAALAITGVQAYADPGACSGDCWAHDPAVIRRSSDGVYFRFNTGSEIGIW